jgi:hypothetical protein
MGTTTVADYELSVPARFVALFRLSLVDEVRFDADWVKDQLKPLRKFYEAEDPSDPDVEVAVEHPAFTLDARLADLDSPIRSLSDDYAMLEGVLRHSAQEDLTTRGPFGVLHGALEAMVRRVAKDMVHEAGYSPIDGARIVHRASAAVWAAAEIERLNTEVQA